MGKQVRVWLRHLGLILASGTILFFFSERLFWAVARPGDTWRDLALTWLVYVLSGYLFLTLLYAFRVNGRESLFVAGAAFGWLIEGVWVLTLYGTEPSAPFPLSIVITGLSWHALISVLCGWYGARWALTRWGVRGALLYALAAGILWGLWAPFTWSEVPPIVASVPAFFTHAILASALFVLSLWLLEALRLDQFRPGRVTVALVILLHVAGFVAGPMRIAGIWSLVILPPLLGLVLILLWMSRNVITEHQTILEAGSRTAPLAAYLGLLVLPFVATATYAAALALRPGWPPVHQFVFFATGVAGGVYFLRCIWAVVVRIPHKSLRVRPS